MLFECISVALIFGIVPLIEKFILSFITIESYLIFTVLCMLFFCLCYVLYTRNFDIIMKDINILNKNYHLYFVIFFTTFFMFVLGEYLYLYLIVKNKTYLVVCLIASYPIITSIIGHTFFKETLSVKNMTGVFLTTLGVIILSMK
jgi:uncharacterized membrane protein